MCCRAPPAWRVGARGRAIAQPRGSPLGFALEDGFFLQAIVARAAAHQRTLCPLVEHPAHIFPCDACHRGEVALGDLLTNAAAPFPEVIAARPDEPQPRA